VDSQDIEDVFPVGDFSCEVFASWSFFLGCGVQDFEGCLFGWEVFPLSCCLTEPGVEGFDRVGGRDRAKPVLWFWASLFCCRRQVGAHEVHCIAFCTLGMRPLRVRRLRGALQPVVADNASILAATVPGLGEDTAASVSRFPRSRVRSRDPKQHRSPSGFSVRDGRDRSVLDSLDAGLFPRIMLNDYHWVDRDGGDGLVVLTGLLGLCLC